jgi:hypothetical protein
MKVLFCDIWDPELSSSNTPHLGVKIVFSFKTRLSVIFYFVNFCYELNVCLQNWYVGTLTPRLYLEMGPVKK